MEGHNTIMSRILKRRINIESYFNLIDYTPLESTVILQNLLNRSESFPLDRDILYVEVSDHALVRWNARVGPALSLEQLEALFNKLLLIPFRIKKVSEGKGIIDSEIIFTYEKIGRKIIITTLYGRRSLNPSLNHLEKLRRYNGFNNEKIDLDLDESLIKEQELPAIPMVFMKFSGSKTKYSLEGYKVLGKKLPVFVVHSQPGDPIKIDINNRIEFHINKSILKSLVVMNYRDFVWEYLKETNMELVNKLHLNKNFRVF